MTKEQILDAVRKMSRIDRYDVLQEILSCNHVNDFFLCPEQENELQKRLSDVDNGSVKLIDGEAALSHVASKYRIFS